MSDKINNECGAVYPACDTDLTFTVELNPFKILIEVEEPEKNSPL